VSRDHDGSLLVQASAINGYYLTKELVKGTAELICLHGLSSLNDPTYEQVIQATDRMEYEPAMLQSGSELWRRLLRAIPSGVSPAHVLMRLARSSTDTVTEILAEVIEERANAQRRILDLCDAE
jgi:hypothetical protein